MKKILFVAITALLGFNGMAQFKTGTLQAAGLTCAMCTKAINETLKDLDFVQTVKADIKNSQFIIHFKEGSSVDPDALRNAVEDAGFSLARLKLSLHFDNVQVGNDSHIKIGNKNYHFLGIPLQILNGEKILTFVDRHFVLAKEFKKYASKTQMVCVQTGKMESCCVKQGIKENARIYHVTI